MKRDAVSSVPLKDINVCDKTQKLSPLLHGRKASTYLGIFRDDQVLADTETAAAVASLSSLGQPATSSSLALAKKRRNNTFCEQDALRLKPVSSATYYPHTDVPETVLARSRSSSRSPSPTGLVSAGLHKSAVNDTAAERDTTLTTVSTGGSTNSDDVQVECPLAVELKPFTDNVGGHTAIFRFSKRAVCKALVNRENKWYENIEWKHKELLQFMPRYIGVLNVRQHYEIAGSANSKSSLSDSSLHRETCDLGLYGGNNALDAYSLEQANDSGHVLKHIESLPLANEHFTSSCRLPPEVVIDDNKHIIPDSLWGKYSADDALRRSNSYARSQSFSKEHYERDSGATMINTELKDLVLEEVFAPRKYASASGNVASILENKYRSVSNENGKSEESASDMPRNKKLSSPLLRRSAKNSISNSLESSNSVMDLKQFRQRAEVKESILQGKPLQFNPSSRGSLDETISRSRDQIALSDNKHDDYAVVDDFEDDEVNVKSTAPPNVLQNESVLYEEHSHTVVSKFILLEDLTRKLKRPCALDLKMGTRQYGVDAKRSKQISQRAKCMKTTSRRLGVRICGLKIWNKDYYITRDKYFGRRVKIGWQFARVLARFLYDGSRKRSILEQIPQLIKQLDTLRTEVEKLKGYRLYGSSLLLMYDGDRSSWSYNSHKWKDCCSVKVNLIDFARCVTKDDMRESFHEFRIPPRSPETEDKGFIRGIRSLRFYLLIIWNYLTNDTRLILDEIGLNEFLNSPKFDEPWGWLDTFDQESEEESCDPESPLRKKWRKYELIFDVEPRYTNNDADVSE